MPDAEGSTEAEPTLTGEALEADWKRLKKEVEELKAQQARSLTREDLAEILSSQSRGEDLFTAIAAGSFREVTRLLKSATAADLSYKDLKKS